MPDSFDPALLRTVHVVPLTAFGADGTLNSGLQAGHTRALAEAGMRVFLPAAGTSEFHSLSADEVVELVQTTKAAAGDGSLVFAPVGMQLNNAIDVGRRSIDAGADGILFMPLVHAYLSDKGARDYYRAVLDAVPAPAVVYKKGPIPGDELLLELGEWEQVVGVKYAVNEVHEFRTALLADSARPAEHRLEWLCGSAERFAPYFMLAGATGYTTGAGNVCPHVTLAMHAAFAAGEFRGGMRLQNVILPIEDYRGRSGDSYNISMLKHAMSVVGNDFGAPRPPQRQLTPGEQSEIATLLQPILAVEAELRGEMAGVGLVSAL